MFSYCLVCKKNTENKEPNVIKTKNNRLMLTSNCTICDNKKSRFIYYAKGLLSNLGIKIPLLNFLF